MRLSHSWRAPSRSSLYNGGGSLGYVEVIAATPSVTIGWPLIIPNLLVVRNGRVTCRYNSNEGKLFYVGVVASARRLSRDGHRTVVSPSFVTASPTEENFAEKMKKTRIN